MVPGPDGKQGYGGACFPKDTAAISNLFNSLTMIKETINKNNEYRLSWMTAKRLRMLVTISIK